MFQWYGKYRMFVLSIRGGRGQKCIIINFIIDNTNRLYIGKFEGNTIKNLVDTVITKTPKESVKFWWCGVNNKGFPWDYQPHRQRDWTRSQNVLS